MAEPLETYIGAEQRKARREFVGVIWQNGPIGEVGVNGALPEDVLEVALERLRELNQGDFRCRENSLVITHVEDALNWILRRRLNRLEAGVLGTTAPHPEKR